MYTKWKIIQQKQKKVQIFIGEVNGNEALFNSRQNEGERNENRGNIGK